MGAITAHIVETIPSGLLGGPELALGCLAVGFTLWLVMRHHAVKHPPSGLRLGERLRIGQVTAVALAVIVGAAVLPGSAASQGQDMAGLPDLISDPPRPSALKELRDEDGALRLVMTFDGYVHNIGEGPLDVVGNPQVPGGMVQRVLADGEWREVSAPTVRYETDDGHDHFHLIEAVDYVLWNESQGAQTAAGSKIGFCLVDSEQMEPGSDQAYSEELDNFCQENNPTATSLRMGISPGWRDIYDATTTLQWVDISDTAPGRYWIGAITDPNDEIVESNEDNNALVFSDRPAVVPGWLATDAVAETTGEAIEIELSAEAFGTVGQAIYLIEEQPANGRLDTPIGSSSADATVIYTPDAGFTGTDSIEFSVRDASSSFPLLASTATITIDVADTGQPSASEAETVASPTITLPTTLFETEVGQAFSLEVDAVDAAGEPVAVHAVGLPSGLWIEGGTVLGSATKAGFGDVDFIAIDAAGNQSVQAATFIVNERTSQGLSVGIDRSSPLMREVQLTVGTSILGASFEADGLPDGLTIDPNSATVSGRPTQVGTFAVELRQTNQDGTEVVANFDWTIRAAVAISFAL